MERVNEKDKEFRFGDSGPKYIFRGPKMEWGILVLKPAETMGAHYHEKVEETFFFCEGEPEIIINGVSQKVKEGDAFRIEPKEKHDIVNNTASKAKVIFIKCPYLPEDKIKAS